MPAVRLSAGLRQGPLELRLHQLPARHAAAVHSLTHSPSVRALPRRQVPERQRHRRLRELRRQLARVYAGHEQVCTCCLGRVPNALVSNCLYIRLNFLITCFLKNYLLLKFACGLQLPGLQRHQWCDVRAGFAASEIRCMGGCRTNWLSCVVPLLKKSLQRNCGARGCDQPKLK